MKNWITIITFTYPHEAHIVKAKLESEGVTVQIKDELTVQAHNFLSNAVGGVKVQVPEREMDLASRILEEAGYNLGRKEEVHPIVVKLEQWTSKIPLIGKRRLELRLLILIAFLLLIFLVPLALFGIQLN